MVIVVDVNTSRSEEFKTNEFTVLLESISDEFKVPINVIILFNTKGREITGEIDPSDTHLFLFPRETPNFSYRVTKRDWVNFQFFQGLTTYEERFKFEDYGAFPEHYQRIPEIEAELFQIVSLVKKAYAKFMTSKQYLKSKTAFLNVRITASKIILNNFKHYYREVKKLTEDFYKDFSAFQTSADDAKVSFDINFKHLNKEEFELSLGDQCRAHEVEEFARNFKIAVSKLDQKCMDLQKKQLPPIKKQLETLLNSLKTRESFFESFKADYNEFNAREMQVKFLVTLEALTEYNIFRKNLEIIMGNSEHDRYDKAAIAQSMLNEDKLNDLKNINFADLETINNRLFEFENKVQDDEKRIIDFFENKAVKFCVENTQRLKYQVKHTVLKMQTKLQKLKSQREMLYLPTLYKEAAQAATEEIERRQRSNRDICGLYAELSRLITRESECREDFMLNYGSDLPRNIYPELTSRSLLANHLQHLLHVEDAPLPEQRATVDSNTLILHYQSELRKLEEALSKKLSQIKKQGERLEQDLMDTSLLLDTVKKENSSLKEEALNYTTELKLLNDRLNEGRSKTFKAEIDKLKMREEAFKRLHIDLNSQLQEENSRLRFQLSSQGRIGSSLS